MKRVTGIGGIFFKGSDAATLYEWYKKHLGIEAMPGAGAMFPWRDAENPDKKANTVWCIFDRGTKYFGDGTQGYMVNYRVENLDALLEALAAEGVQIDPKRDNSDYGKFAWIIDPDGNRIELWEPPADED